MCDFVKYLLNQKWAEKAGGKKVVCVCVCVVVVGGRDKKARWASFRVCRVEAELVFFCIPVS